MNIPDSQSQHRRATDLIGRHLLGTITDDESRELETLLTASAEVRENFRRQCNIDAALRQQAGELNDAVTPAHRTRRVALWSQSRALVTAAASLCVGLLSASLAWAYVGLQSVRPIPLLHESFESGPEPLTTGVPIELGVWAGDYANIVPAQQEVKPEDGMKMLRFLRGDYEGREIPSSHSSDVFRLVDLRPYRREYADGGVVVQLTAVFNALPFPDDESFSATLTLFALTGSVVGNEMLKAENVLSTESLAFSRSSKVAMDRDPATWQRVINELRLPPESDYLMLRMGMSNDTKSEGKRRDRFAGHFVDKVQLVIARRAEIPVP